MSSQIGGPMGFLFDLIAAYWWIILLVIVALAFGLQAKRGRG